jgi:circadian clock protein KaiB
MNAKATGSRKEVYILKLYITGMSLASLRALENITRVCEAHLKGCYSLEVIDIYKHPVVVLENNIIACPTLIKESPGALKRIIGDLSDTARLLNGLGITIHD